MRKSNESKLVAEQNTIIETPFCTALHLEFFLHQAKQVKDLLLGIQGSLAIVEGCGAHGCEYMTGGTAIILGAVGDNFGAGMTGGMAFIYDEKDEFEKFVNPTSIIWQKVETDYWKKFLQENIVVFQNQTGSQKAKKY